MHGLTSPDCTRGAAPRDGLGLQLRLAAVVHRRPALLHRRPRPAGAGLDDRHGAVPGAPAQRRVRLVRHGRARPRGARGDRRIDVRRDGRRRPLPDVGGSASGSATTSCRSSSRSRPPADRYHYRRSRYVSTRLGPGCAGASCTPSLVKMALMCFSTACWVRNSLAAIAAFVRPWAMPAQHFPLSWGQAVGGPGRRPRSSVDRGLDDLGVDRGSPGGDRFDGPRPGRRGQRRALSIGSRGRWCPR